MIDDDVRFLSESLLSAANEEIPLVKPSFFRYQFNAEIRDPIRKRNDFRILAKHDKRYRRAVNYLNRDIKRLTETMKAENWNKKLRSSDTPDLSLYKMA